MGYEDPTDLSKSLQVTLTPRFFPLRIPEFEGAEMKTHFHRPSPSALKFPHHIPTILKNYFHTPKIGWETVGGDPLLLLLVCAEINARFPLNDRLPPPLLLHV